MREARPAVPVSRLLTGFDRFLDAIARSCLVVTGVSLVALTAIFGWLVFGRYVLNATPTWVEQASLLLVMIITFLGAPVGLHENSHLSVMALRNVAPRPLLAAMVVLSDLMLAGFGLLMLVYGARLTMFKWGSMIPLLNLPEGLRSLPLTIGGALVALFSLGNLLRYLLGRERPGGEAAQ